MRLKALTFSDIRFQWKYGFYILYAIFTVVYLLTLSAIPNEVRRIVSTAMIYADPAAMGLFFMGAIILLEKSQHVNSALATSTVREWEYMLAKLISISVIGVLVGAILAIAGGINNIFLCLISIILSSFICSSCGLIAAIHSKSLNHFVILAVPFEIFLCLPPLLLLFGIENPWMMLHPGFASVWLIYGDAPNTFACILSLLLWCIPSLYFCLKSVNKYFSKIGGVTL